MKIKLIAEYILILLAILIFVLAITACEDTSNCEKGIKYECKETYFTTTCEPVTTCIGEY